MSVSDFCRRTGICPPYRHLPPGGVPLPVGDIVAAAGTALATGWQRASGDAASGDAGRAALAALGTALHALTGCRHAFALGTGRAALSVTLQAMRRLAPARDVVLLPAYTSYSVAAAAVHAGLLVRLYDLDPATLAPRMEDVTAQLDDRVLAVVACHLFGYPVPTGALRDLCHGAGAMLVDDAAQAMGARSADGLAGTTGDAGLFSLARGKNITAVDGGLVVTDDDALAAAVAGLVPWAALPCTASTAATPSVTTAATPSAPGPVTGLATGDASGAAPGEASGTTAAGPSTGTSPAPARGRAAEAVADMRLLARVVMLRLFLNPALYWVPASLPFLGIGTSRFDPDFEVGPLRPLQATLAARAMARLDAINGDRSRVATALEQRLHHVPGLRTLCVQPGAMPVHLRLPVLPEACEWPGDTVPEASRLGLVRSYPLSLQDLAAEAPRLAAHLLPGPDCPASRWLAATLLTLPTHAGVTEDDMDAMADNLSAVMAGVPAGEMPGVPAGGTSGGTTCGSYEAVRACPAAGIAVSGRPDGGAR
ncbi:DegT/DnrJ/EryC1/StrS family aminotransferase [Nitratidesulfovibrio vulgaris]|uniref:Aminotransferase, DegT/DnrJ/EryC1/StrS family n=1 Tax=Nitratidesulfovibrio vulgaris (strain ATCC 29579 / DSM 644 / CCUG 34227 / NCIMB 8303 / VKM B-1760 / Hildenborough) TaxID=882 RepID=Q72WP4_NITV2|nr:DegT/DnrJ/EryC1/StrS family aminotransferase [Nitratidesulfovibrio vulgaris]AAS94406.1 aminotransferase, DegT/DnrJ/EryC1/StrS family [Nitratidesulfovibrio vulgaris str. Hildenborough]ADP88277.1 DegT/DnrJ/EryC1/StrS aminotransferase [Nitratidesulfovibrio vulgaris RCH1]